MNTEVVNEIFKRRPARDFLRLYPSDKWKELIPDIFEIGVLNLKNSFGTLKFTKNQIKDILVDLRNYKPNEEEINTNNININNNNYEDKNNFEEENYNNNSDEEEEYNENENDEQKNNNKLNNKNMINKEKEDIRERTANAEVFIPDENRHVIKVNYNRPKIAYNSTMEEIREQNIENKRNLGYTESKIKYQIINDKRNHQMKKRKISDDNNNDNNNDGNFSFNKNKNKNKREKNLNKNYVINFDKNLNPGKPIEIQKNKFKYNIQNNNNFNNNNVNNNNFNNNYNDYNEENIFNSFNNNNNSVNNENNQINNEQNLQNHLNNYKINMLNFPRYEFDRNNLNNN